MPPQSGIDDRQLVEFKELHQMSVAGEPERSMPEVLRTQAGPRGPEAAKSEAAEQPGGEVRDRGSCVYRYQHWIASAI